MVLEGDIAACFDELSHDWLLTHIPLEKAMLRQWLKAGFMERSVWHTTEAGSPWGHPLERPPRARHDHAELGVSRAGRGRQRSGEPIRSLTEVPIVFSLRDGG